MSTPLRSELRPALVLFCALSLLCGLLYPLATAGLGRVAFAGQAAGSLLRKDGVVVGSRLIGQAFTAPGYFWGRPPASAPIPNDAANSGGSNLGPGNPALAAMVQSRIAALRGADPDNRAPIPVDLVTASASGLDPEISLAAAYYQAPRVARARRLTPVQVRAMIDRQKEERYFGFFGEARVNVLALNLALDRLLAERH